ncbi:hypothetical protein N7495_002150 [Penicillium taxi]|uniref:uncharacterized protein n=1 Tax=Penicillium taxi TaxID=168475 RepID=UPI0025455C86|nr:uncharacterized protein N7495_002150 [Penicillium taxi]KAJ5901622.1 hypothetical protein N7495_002150 [Penicillium taxi]
MINTATAAASCFSGKTVQITSDFTEYSDLSTWGWESEDADLDDASGAESSEPSFYESLISEKTSKFIKWTQKNTVTVDGVVYDVSASSHTSIKTLSS